MARWGGFRSEATVAAGLDWKKGMEASDFLFVADIVFYPAIGVSDRLSEMFFDDIAALGFRIGDCSRHDGCRLRASGGEMGVKNSAIAKRVVRRIDIFINHFCYSPVVIKNRSND